MNITVTTFTNPFSFFCCVDNDTKAINLMENNGSAGGSHNLKARTNISDFDHGQYVAVMWNNKWVRGVVTMENQFLIWLVDYGKYLRPTERTVLIDLPAEYRKHPTKVFEASIHGVCPLDKVLTDDCQIKNAVTTSWNKGAIEKAQTLIASALSIYFVPVAILSTKFNDIVLGDLYLQIMGKGYINIVDELELWPIFLERNEKDYFKHMPIYYTTRRKHRTSTLKPEFPDLEYKVPTITFETPLQEYNRVAESALAYTPRECGSSSGDGSTVVRRYSEDEYKLSHSEILKYSNMFVNIHGHEYNVLGVLMCKLQDLRICERYKDHDLKRVGRASSRRTSAHDE